MARVNGLEKMSYGELAELRTQIERVMVEKQNFERPALRQQMADMAREHGLSLDEVLGKVRKGKGTVAPKYRDPKNLENTWTGRFWPYPASAGTMAIVPANQRTCVVFHSHFPGRHVR